MANKMGGTDSNKAAQRIKNFGAGAGMSDRERIQASAAAKIRSKGAGNKMTDKQRSKLSK